MPEFKGFTVEGPAVLGYYSDEEFGEERRVQIVSGENGPSFIEHIIAQSLEFPSEMEFDGMFERNSALAEQGLQPLEETPDITREGVRLRITVEVLT